MQVNGKLIRELKDVPAPGGVAQVDLGEVARGATVNVKVHFRGDARQLHELRSVATARLRPDLVVAEVHAPPQTLSTRAIDVVADISELKQRHRRAGDRDADARADARRGVEDRHGAGGRQRSRSRSRA